MFGYGAADTGASKSFAIEKYFNLVKPDLTVWLYFTNDLINSSSELESESDINRSGRVRPYLTNDQIEWVLPKKLGKEMRSFPLWLNAGKPLNSVEIKPFVGGPAHAVFLESTEVTENIMRMTKRRAERVPIVANGRLTDRSANSLVENSRQRDIMILNDVEGGML